MGMDEKEVQALQDKVGPPDLLDPVVKAWIVAALAQEQASLKKLRAEFWMHKKMRNDAGMTQLSARVDATWKMIEALKEMQTEGSSQDSPS